jgi:hypothetical protein
MGTPQEQVALDREMSGLQQREARERQLLSGLGRGGTGQCLHVVTLPGSQKKW